MEGKGEIVRETLRIPESVLTGAMDEAALEELRRWADPLFPETPWNPYVSQMDAAAVRKLLTGDE
jgi:hypothetical protein